MKTLILKHLLLSQTHCMLLNLEVEMILRLLVRCMWSLCISNNNFDLFYIYFLFFRLFLIILWIYAMWEFKEIEQRLRSDSQRSLPREDQLKPFLLSAGKQTSVEQWNNFCVCAATNTNTKACLMGSAATSARYVHVCIHIRTFVCVCVGVCQGDWREKWTKQICARLAKGVVECRDSNKRTN